MLTPRPSGSGPAGSVVGDDNAATDARRAKDAHVIRTQEMAIIVSPVPASRPAEVDRATPSPRSLPPWVLRPVPHARRAHGGKLRGLGGPIRLTRGQGATLDRGGFTHWVPWPRRSGA